MVAAGRGKRTVIATETLALQSQIVDHDAPALVGAAEQLFGLSPAVAVFKGFKNFPCRKATVELADDTSLFTTRNDDGGRAQALADWVTKTEHAGGVAEKDNCPDTSLWSRM